jgi:hypothetical protein
MALTLTLKRAGSPGIFFFFFFFVVASDVSNAPEEGWVWQQCFFTQHVIDES